MPILSQFLKAELAEREVRSIRCPAGDACIAERGLSHEVRVRRENSPPDCFLIRLTPAYKDLSGFDFATSEINEATVRQLHRCPRQRSRTDGDSLARSWMGRKTSS